ncbi:hypothetical protein VTH06DRAFT_3573 [Thermothelomyces fergusii]
MRPVGRGLGSASIQPPKSATGNTWKFSSPHQIFESHPPEEHLDIDIAPEDSTTPSKCRATRRSVSSRSSPRPRSRTGPFPNGFGSALATPLGTTPSGGTGARPASASKCHPSYFLVRPQRTLVDSPHGCCCHFPHGRRQKVFYPAEPTDDLSA